MFITYKIVCTLSGQYYIGSHKTDDINDNYMGSGRLIKKSIDKYGVENHYREILGIFDTREESLSLEHLLVRQKRRDEPSLCLNQTNGGSSFDHINNNLTFDRAAFGRLASHQHNIQRKIDSVAAYERNPKHCSHCGKAIEYDHRQNIFCSSSCAATYNNKGRRKALSATYCKYCGKSLQIKNYYHKQFCNNACATRYRYETCPPPITDKRKRVLQDLKIIRKRHETESYRQIAEDYAVSGNFIKNAVKGRLH